VSCKEYTLEIVDVKPFPIGGSIVVTVSPSKPVWCSFGIAFELEELFEATASEVELISATSFGELRLYFEIRNTVLEVC
jgi:hypothetical protein